MMDENTSAMEDENASTDSECTGVVDVEDQFLSENEDMEVSEAESVVDAGDGNQSGPGNQDQEGNVLVNMRPLRVSGRTPHYEQGPDLIDLRQIFGCLLYYHGFLLNTLLGEKYYTDNY